MSQADLSRRLKQAADPAEKRDLALELLAATRSREYVDQALRALARDDVIALLGDAHRPVLRDKALYYFEHDDRDRGGLIREQITRLLMQVRHPGDVDLFCLGAETYYRQPVTDTAQNLRAAALVGLAGIDQALGCAYAVRLLGEPDTSELNGEPSLTSVKVLAVSGQVLPVYLFVLRLGQSFIANGQGEVVGKALEVLGGDLPPALYRPLAEQFADLDSPAASSGLLTAIVEARLEDLYLLLERIITATRHDTLHRFGVILMAAARDDVLTAMLYRLAKVAHNRIENYIEAVELTSGEDRDDLLMTLERRL